MVALVEAGRRRTTGFVIVKIRVRRKMRKGVIQKKSAAAANEEAKE